MYNAGPGGKFKGQIFNALKAKDYPAAAKAIPNFAVTSKNKRLRGLEQRRLKEQNMFLTLEEKQDFPLSVDLYKEFNPDF